MSQSLFLMGCIPARLLLALAALYLPETWMAWFSLALLAVGVGFIFLFFTGKRKTGMETEGKPIWWRPFRIVHGLVYGLAAYFVWTKNRKAAFTTLLLDTLFGLGLFLYHYYL